MTTNDKYMYNFIRLKIIDKSGSDIDVHDKDRPLTMNERLVENTSITTLNACSTETITFQPNNGKGYSLICESMPPYDLAALNLDLEVISNKDNLELERVEMMDPLIYSDVYVPYKYGIIFKEKIYVGGETSAAFSVKLTQKIKVKKMIEPQLEGQEEPAFEEIEQVVDLQKTFKIEIFDSQELISSYHGHGKITISHFNFRGNAGLEERPSQIVAEGAEPPKLDPNKEYKHSYVIMATFDKNDWKTATVRDSEETQNIRWELKVFSSDTLAIVKDTDKEDREKALKDSWEVAEPGRAEKSRKSRIRFIAMSKQKEGVELTEEEKEVLKEKRVRGAANLKEAVPDPKAAKGKGDKKAQVVEEEEKVEEVPVEFPKSTDYTNLHIKEFIHHFENDRLIHAKCHKSGARLRNEREIEERRKEVEDEVRQWEEIFNTRLQNRDAEGKDREAKNKQMIDIIMKSRKDFKEKTETEFANRNKYRELISNRKHKEILLTDILNSDKIEIAPLEQALHDAVDALVRQDILDKAKKKLENLKYSKGIEDELQAAFGEKNAEKMNELIAKIEKENLLINPKLVADTKTALSKMK